MAGVAGHVAERAAEQSEADGGGVEPIVQLMHEIARRLLGRLSGYRRRAAGSENLLAQDGDVLGGAHPQAHGTAAQADNLDRYVESGKEDSLTGATRENKHGAGILSIRIKKGSSR
jgi:hypothetical protein